MKDPVKSILVYKNSDLILDKLKASDINARPNYLHTISPLFAQLYPIIKLKRNLCFLVVFVTFQYGPGSGVVLDCIDSLSLPFSLLL